MNRDGRIYQHRDAPAEDRARLEGYLRGRAEAAELEELEELRDSAKAQVEKVLAERRSRGPR